MSTLKVTNIQATGETASRAVSGVAAAFSNVASNQSTLNDSLNISSIADSGTGLCTHTFTNAFANNPFTNAGQSIQQYDNTGLDRFVTQNASSIRTDVRNTSNSARDDAFSMTLHGDLA
jgi:hypothetical protein